MKFTRDQTSGVTIRQVGSGMIQVGNQTLDQDVALTSDEVISGWRNSPIEQMTEQDIEPLIACDPELILLGTGSRQRFAPRELVFALARRGIGLETMDTAAACRTFNILVSEGRRVAAVLIVK